MLCSKNQQNVKNPPACLVTWLCFVRIVVKTQLSLAGNYIAMKLRLFTNIEPTRDPKPQLLKLNQNLSRKNVITLG